MGGVIVTCDISDIIIQIFGSLLVCVFRQLLLSLLTIIAGVDLLRRHESELPVYQTQDLNSGHQCE